MPRVAKSKPAKSASVAGGGRARKKRKSIREMSVREYAEYAPKHGLGARVLTRAEAEKIMGGKPPAPGEPTAHDALREFLRPIREYNRWCAKTGHEPLEEMEMDPSLREERRA